MTTKRTKRHADLFKPIKKGDKLCCVYLYSDGHATASFERYIRDTDSTVRYYKQIDTLGLRCSFTGRTVWSQYGGLDWLLTVIRAGATRIGGVVASMANGSEGTRAKGIPVGYVTADIPGIGTLYNYDFPSVHSSGGVVQPDMGETFDPTLATYGYGDSKVAETLLTLPETASQGAA